MMIPFDYLHDKYNMNVTGVFHIGGNDGQERFIYDKYCKGWVLWVEAIPQRAVDLHASLINDGLMRQAAVSACLSNKNGEVVKFNISNNDAQSSSFLELGHHSIIHPEVRYIDSIELETMIGSDVLDLYSPNSKSWNLLNIDVQGAELQVLQGIGNKMSQFEYAIIEINKKETYIGGALVDDIDYFMLQHGFERVETGPWVGESWTDGFYKKIRA